MLPTQGPWCLPQVARRALERAFFERFSGMRQSVRSIRRRGIIHAILRPRICASRPYPSSKCRIAGVVPVEWHQHVLLGLALPAPSSNHLTVVCAEKGRLWPICL
jgi:hypothetical protein